MFERNVEWSKKDIKYYTEKYKKIKSFESNPFFTKI